MKNINAFENKEKVKLFSKKQNQFSSDYCQKMGDILLSIDKIKKNEPKKMFAENNNIIQTKENIEEEKEDKIITEKNEDIKNEIIDNNNNINDNI